MSLDKDGFYDVPSESEEVREKLEQLIWEYRQAGRLKLSSESQKVSTELWIEIEKMLNEHLK